MQPKIIRRKITGFLVSLFLASWTVDCESSDCGGPLKSCCLASPLTGPHKGKDHLRNSAVAWPCLLTRPSLKAVTWSTHLLFSRNVWGVKRKRERWIYVPMKEREKERSEVGHSSDDFAWHLSGIPPRSGSPAWWWFREGLARGINCARVLWIWARLPEMLP